MTNNALATKPKLYRAGVARGLSESGGAVCRDGGDYGHGVIYGAAVITRGEALGHEAWIDGDMLDQVVDATNEMANGVKARFTHPSLSGDGLGKYLGRFKNAVRDGDIVRADMHFTKAGHKSPDGDLASYVMDLAEQDPDAFGISIVFEHDVGEMARFDADHTDEHGDFISPDPDNDRNLEHVRLSNLRAADAVDEPAANPAGLFHRGGDIAGHADRLLSYAFGLDDSERPELQFNIDPDRARGFASRWLNQHGLSLTPKEPIMAEPIKNSTDLNAGDTTAAEPTEAGEPVAEPVDDTAAVEPAAPAADEPAELSTGQRFLDAFGDQGGVWFAQGKTFEDATQLHIEALTARNAELEAKVAKQSEDRGGEAIGLNAADTKPGKLFAEHINPSK